jgi:hypothetical protein
MTAKKSLKVELAWGKLICDFFHKRSANHCFFREKLHFANENPPRTRNSAGIDHAKVWTWQNADIHPREVKLEPKFAPTAQSQSLS